MAAYIHASIEVTDPVAYEQYRNEVPAVLAAYGGHFLVRGGDPELLEGDACAARQVILEFPDMEHLQAFYRSPEYQRLIVLRQSASTGTLVALKGV